MTELTPEQKMDEIVGTFISLKFDIDTDEFSDGTLERWNDMKQQLLSLLEEEKIIIKQQMKANVWTKFKLEMAKQDLSARPPKGTRFRTPLEELTLILEQEAPLNDLDRLQALKQPSN